MPSPAYRHRHRVPRDSHSSKLQELTPPGVRGFANVMIRLLRRLSNLRDLEELGSCQFHHRLLPTAMLLITMERKRPRARPLHLQDS